MRSSVVVLLASTLFAASPSDRADGAASGPWLPPAVEEGLAGQLTDRLQASIPGEHDETELAATSTRVVAAMRGVLEQRGVPGTLAGAPTFPELEIPSGGDPHLDAMAGYQVCNLLLALQLQDEAFAGDWNARLASIFGMTGLTMAVVHLRQPYLAAGGEMARVERHLAGPALEPAFAKIQEDPSARGHAEERCRPAVHALLEAPLGQLGDR